MSYGNVVGGLVRKAARSMLLLVAVVGGHLDPRQVRAGRVHSGRRQGLPLRRRATARGGVAPAHDEVLKQVEAIVCNTHGVRSAVGFGRHQHSQLAELPQRGHDVRGPGILGGAQESPSCTPARLPASGTRKFAAIPGARAFAFGPPPLPGYGNVSGFTMQLQDRSGGSIEQLAGYVQQLQAAGGQASGDRRVSTTFNPATPQVRVELDREKPRPWGAGGQRVSDFAGLPERALRERLRPLWPRLQGVSAGESEFTSQPEDIGQFYVRNNGGQMVPLSTLVKVSKMSGPNFVTRFNLYNAAEIMGAPAPGYSSGQAIKAIEEVMKTMPSEVGYEWSGLTLQEKKSEGQARHHLWRGGALRLSAAGGAV
jgi:multidrug efflux pump subunit AcrB